MPLLLALILQAAGTAAGENPSPGFGTRTVKSEVVKLGPADVKEVRRQLHSRSSVARADAVRKLSGFPPVEGAKLAVQVGLGDRDVDVRRAAYETLLVWRNDAQVGNYLLEALKRDAAPKKANLFRAAPVLAVLLAAEPPDTQRGLAKFIETWLAKSKDGPPILAAVADELGVRADAESLATLNRLTRQKFFADYFVCRRAVVQAMIGMRTTESLDALVALLAKVDGEVRGDIVRYLQDISGQRIGCDAKAWNEWWKTSGKGFKFPERGTASASAGVVPQGAPAYYGLPLYAKRVVFIINVSGSMNGPRLAAAKRELTRVISSLDGDAELGVTAFSTQVWLWRKHLAPATAANKKEALHFVNRLMAHGRTATYDALEAAMNCDPEAIYLLSDGEPNAGKVTTPAGIVKTIGEANRSRRISIYTIGIAPGAAEGANESFMKELAEQNCGLYQRVDE